MKFPRVRFTVRRMMAIVAIVGVLLSAWLYRREHGNIERSLMFFHLRAFQEGTTGEQRRMALENLSISRSDDLVRIVPALVAGVGDDDWRVRREAALSFVVLFPRLIQAGNDSGGETTALATGALLRACDDPYAEVRLEAVRSLKTIRQIASMLSANRGGSPAVSTVGAMDRQAFAPLLRMLNDPDPSVRGWTLETLTVVAPALGEGPEPIFKVMLNDPSSYVRGAAIRALAQGWTASSLFPLFLRRLKEVSTQEEKSAIGWAIFELPTPPVESVPALIDALTLDSYELRQSIPEALAKLGPEARPALPALAKLAAVELKNPRDSALDAARAIAAIDPDSVEARTLLEPIVTLLRNSPEEPVRYQATRVLKKYGPSGAAAVPSLRMALKSEVKDVRQRAASLLGSIGPPARSALEELNDLSRSDPDPDVRKAAADATKRIDDE